MFFTIASQPELGIVFCKKIFFRDKGCRLEKKDGWTTWREINNRSFLKNEQKINDINNSNKREKTIDFH